MPKVLVTGANGHIGCNLVRDLLEHDYTVVALVREGANTTGIDKLAIEMVRGNVVDGTNVDAAMKDCEIVFHLAAPYEIWSKDKASIIDPASKGTETVLRAAKKAGVRRVVVTSSCNAVGFTPDPKKPYDETHWNEDPKSPYLVAKKAQEERAWALAKELDLDVVTVLPTAVLGRFDYKKTPTTTPVIDAVKGGGPVPFAMNVVDVRDVARGHVLAAEKGRRGERYLLGGENADADTIASLIEKHGGKRPPTKLPPMPILRTVAFFAEGISRLTGKTPMLTGDLLDDSFGGRAPIFDTTKMRKELGLDSPRGPEEIMIETLRWALFRGWIPEKQAAKLRDKFPPASDW